MLQGILHCFFPPISLRGERGEWITEEERRELRQCAPLRLEGTFLRAVGFRNIDHLVAADTYESSPLLRVALQRFKYKHVLALTPVLGELLGAALALLLTDTSTVLCPVPLHWRRLFARGWNQVDELANAVMKHTGITAKPLLQRIRDTGQQVGRERRERKREMQHAFALNPGHIPLPDHVVLIDDVATTGATLSAAANILRQAGVNRIDAAVVALA